MNRYFKIQYIILLALLLRLYNISSPLIGIHSWRQADTAAMARNFFENGMNILYPQVDWGGNTAGYVESEFPLYPYLVAAVYKILGINELWGRLLSILFSLAAIYYLYRLVSEIIDKKTALWSALLTAVLPLNVFFSRAFMPESAMLACSVAGIYYFNRWTEDESIRSLGLSALFVSLASLLKLPALYLGVPIFFLAWKKYRSDLFFNFRLWMYASGILLSVFLWYYHAHRILLNGGLTFGIWEYGSDKWGNWELLSTFKFWNGILLQSLAEKHFTWAGFILFISGLFLTRKSGKEYVFDVWLLSVFVYFIIVARGNYVHSYYQLPFMIPGVVYPAKVFSRFFIRKEGKRTVVLVLAVCLSGILILGAWRYLQYMQYEVPEKSAEFRLALEIDKNTAPDKLLVLMDGRDPTVFYLSHRKGWHLAPGELSSDFLQRKIGNGAGYFAGLKKLNNAYLPQKVEPLISGRALLFDDDEMFVAELGKVRGK
jgi:4-amino-4-deoxy-L-arabinose transferase-like glycosyltransferase